MSRATKITALFIRYTCLRVEVSKDYYCLKVLRYHKTLPSKLPLLEISMQKIKYIGLAVVFCWFMFGGISHFTSPEFFLNIMPSWLGWQLTLVYISGVFEILGAIGIVIARTRIWAGYGLFALTIAVTPVNIHMWLNPQLFPDIAEPMLSIRLLIQVLLLACIVWSTRPSPKAEPAALPG